MDFAFKTKDDDLPKWFLQAKQRLRNNPEWPALKASLASQLQKLALSLDEKQYLNESLNAATSEEQPTTDERSVPLRNPARPSMAGDAFYQSKTLINFPKKRHLAELSKSELLDLLDSVEVQMSKHSTLYQTLREKCSEQVEREVYLNTLLNRQHSPADVALMGILDGETVVREAYKLVDVKSFRTIFQKSPDMKRTFVYSINTKLSMELRKMIWFACLQDVAVEDDFAKFMSSARIEKMLKLHGGRFYVQCQTVLGANDDYEIIRKSPSLLLCMKHVVLYLYEQQHRIQVKELLKTLCYIVLPVIVVFQADLKVSDVKDLSHTSVSMVAQMCSSLIQLFQQSYYGTILLKDQLFVTFDGLLRTRDSDLQDALFNLNSGGEQGSSCLATLLDIFLRFMFIDVVTVETLIYLWDQIIIGSKESCGHSLLPNLSQVLAWLSAIHAAHLHEALVSCKEDHEIEAIALSHSRFIVPEDYTSELGTYFAPYLKELRLKEIKDASESSSEKRVANSKWSVNVERAQPVPLSDPVLDNTAPPSTEAANDTVNPQNFYSNAEIHAEQPKDSSPALLPLDTVVETDNPEEAKEKDPIRQMIRDNVESEMKLNKEELERQRVLEEDTQAVETQMFGRPLTEDEREEMAPDVKANFQRKLELFIRKKAKALAKDQENKTKKKKSWF